MRYYVAMKMAERGLVSAPNIAIGQPFNIGLTCLSPMGLDGGVHAAAAQYPIAQHAAPQQHAAPPGDGALK